MKELIVVYILIGLVFTLVRTFRVSNDKVKMSSIENELQKVNEATSTEIVSKIVMFIALLGIVIIWPYMLIPHNEKGE